MYDLIQRVRHEVIEVTVLPIAEGVMRTRSGPTRRRDNTYKVTFIRVVRWLHTFEKLNSDNDVQAVGAGARALYELYIDLEWFRSFPDEISRERFRHYADVDRYVAAKKVVDRRKHAESQLIDADIAPIVKVMDALDERARTNGFDSMRALVNKLWGTNASGEPKWPGHWSGQGRLKARVEMLGRECFDHYCQVYPMLCALIHPGPTPEVGVGLSDPEWRENLVSFSYGSAYRLARWATEIFIDLVEVREHLTQYDAALRQLDVWENDAKQSAPL
jgi:hypothetical protein